MLRVTKAADYGIVLMTQFACAPRHGMHTARDLADEVRLPLPMVSKILKILAREGLLMSHRGTKGGYSLARRPDTISVAEIIRALEGPIALTECTDRVHGDCELEDHCPTRGNWHKINQAIRDALQKITLTEMTQPMPKCPVSFTEAGALRPFEGTISSPATRSSAQLEGEV